MRPYRRGLEVFPPVVDTVRVVASMSPRNTDEATAKLRRRALVDNILETGESFAIHSGPNLHPQAPCRLYNFQ